MNLFGEILARTLRVGVEGMLSGKLPMLAKAGFFSLISVVCIMCTGYLSKVEQQLASIPRIETSITELNTNIATLTERNMGQQRIQEMHTRILHGLERRMLRVEETIKETKR